MSSSRSGDHGQATVEAALALPVVAVALLLIVQVGLLLREHVVLTHSVREGARTASVSADAAKAEARVRESSGFDTGRLGVEVAGDLERGGIVRVSARYDAATDVPLVGSLLGDVELRAEVTMRVE